MHTYRKSEDGWTVGYWINDSYSDGGTRSTWYPLSSHDSELSAIKRVNFLNGGSASFAE
jgi:hypothetical protein